MHEPGKITTIVAIACVATTAHAALIHVPADQPTVQAGIDAAATDDTVLVAPGTYRETLRFWGKAITVTGTEPSDSLVVASTIIDASGASEPVASFRDGESRQTRLAGVTLTGSHRDWFSAYGGGFYCNNASPVIEDCIVRDNGASAGAGGFLSSSESLIQRCIIRDNYDTVDGTGIGLLIRGPGSSVTIRDCLVVDNLHTGVDYSSFGGGIACDSGASAWIDRSRVARNVSSYGAGLFCDEADVRITNSVISWNIADIGGGMSHWGGTTEIINSVIANNTGHGSGGGFEITSGEVTLQDCTVTANNANEGAGMRVSSYSAPHPTVRLESTIVWGNRATSIEIPWGGDVVAMYSNISGGWPGTGNIDADPLFCGTARIFADVGLASDSPCIGVGPEGRNVGAARPGCDIVDPRIPRAWRVPSQVTHLRDAARIAGEGDSVLVAAGTYTDRGIAFSQADLFCGPEETGDEVVVDGGGIGTVIELIATGAAVDAGLRLAHLTITGGTVGIRSNHGMPIVEDCTVVENERHGIEASKSSIQLIASEIRDNGDRGVMLTGYTGDEVARVENCIISGHEMDGYYDKGAGMYILRTDADIRNTLLFDNHITGESLGGGGVFVYDGRATFDHCTFAENSGAAIRVSGYDGDINVGNSVLWNEDELEILRGSWQTDVTVEYSDVRGGWTGNGNIDANPRFGSALGHRFILRPGSPAIDTGTGDDDGLDWCEVHPGYCRHNTAAPDMGSYGGPGNVGWLPQ